LTTSDDTLSLLVYGSSKAGKSTLTSTVPLPAMVMDAEGSWKFIDEAGFRSGVKLRKRAWDPSREPLPDHDGTWDILHVKVTSWLAMQQCYVALTQQEHRFASLVLDSITEVQRRCKRNIAPVSTQMQQQHWGQLLDQMDGLIRGYRDLTLLDNSIRCVVLVSEMAMKDGKWRPYMQGAIRDTLPYLVDICGYLYTEFVTDQNTGAVTEKQKRLLIGPHPQYEAGERVGGRLPDTVIDPHISRMLEQIYPPNR
jgi:hypothetical protein